MNKSINKSIKVVKNGGIIIFPTDTAFGIGCRVDSPSSISRLFKLRRRPKEKAVPILVSSIKMAEKYAEITPTARKLMEKYWPGGLTIVVKCREEKVPELARGGGKTIGLRMPKHETTLAIIRSVNNPLIGCSANFAGESTPYKMSDLNLDLISKVDLVVRGRTSAKIASTVVDTTGKDIKVLRSGAVKIDPRY
ncbi:MAG TPA: L-threonylcarbamoyladenylate synthase [Patescibacteria group bacterium]|nr:L-threonylcarbamoyladenylate synthase [Patescibacteria group bacterium]